MYRIRRWIFCSTALAMVIGCAQITSCSGSADHTPAVGSNETLLFACGEAHSAMHMARAMIERREPIDARALDHAHTFLVVLANRSAATPAVQDDLVRWRTGLRERNTDFSLPPRLVAGRLVERDTSALDARLLDVLGPLADRLAKWVAETCAD